MPLFNGNIGVGGKVGPFNIGTNIPISIDPFESKNAEKRPDGVGFDTSINENVASKPKNDINRMLSQVKQSGFFARPCIYYIEIIPSKSMIGKSDVQSIGLNCHTATIPGVSVATKAIDAGYTFREYPYEKIMEPVALSFYLSDDMTEFRFFEQWIKQVYNENRHVGYHTDYAGTINIYQCTKWQSGNSEDLEVVMGVSLIDAYPKTLSALELGYSKVDEIHNITATIMYRDLVYTYHALEGISNKPNELVTRAERIFSETGTLLQDTFDALKLPKLQTLIKNQESFLPIRNPFSRF